MYISYDSQRDNISHDCWFPGWTSTMFMRFPDEVSEVLIPWSHKQPQSTFFLHTCEPNYVPKRKKKHRSIIQENHICPTLSPRGRGTTKMRLPGRGRLKERSRMRWGSQRTWQIQGDSRNEFENMLRYSPRRSGSRAWANDRLRGIHRPMYAGILRHAILPVFWRGIDDIGAEPASVPETVNIIPGNYLC